MREPRTLTPAVHAALLLIAIALPACGSSGSDASPSADSGSADSAPADAPIEAAPPCEAGVPPSAPADTVTDVAFELVAPTGPHKVGTTLLHLVDKSRPETVTPDPSDFREVVVQLYYPTDADGPSAPILSSAEAKVAFGAAGPKFLHVKTHSTFDVPLAAGKFPLVVYSHGLGSNRNDNRALVESLASHGVVVAALSHTYYDSAATLSSGAITSGEGLRGNVDLNELTKTWLADVRFAVAELEARSAPTPCSFLSSHVDFSKMAMLGWSFGGATALHFCAGEPRCVGGVNLDGTFFGKLDEVIDRPFMFLTQRRGEPTWEVLRGKATSTTYTAWIEGQTHANFSGLPRLATALGLPSPGGSIDPARSELLVGRYVQAFLDTVLFGAPSPLLSVKSGVPADAPELVFEVAKAGVVDGTPRILFGSHDISSGSVVPGLTFDVDGKPAPADPTGAAWFDATAGASSLLTAAASGYMKSITRVDAVPRYRSVDLPIAPEGALTLAISASGVDVQSGKSHVLVIAGNCGAGLSATTDSTKTLYFDVKNRADPALTSTSSAGSAAIVNAPPGRMAVTLHHATYDATAPFVSPTGAGPVMVDVVADTLTMLYVACVPH